MNEFISAVIVDTSAFEAEQFNFPGFGGNTLIPSFFKLLLKHDITLLTHPILNGEILKHIKRSKVLEQCLNFSKTLGRHKDLFSIIGVDYTDLETRASNLDCEGLFMQAFSAIYKNAIMLPFPSPNHIFNMYFESLPPFGNSEEQTDDGKNSKKNRKSEFPDAFAIEAIKQYVEETDETVVVISKDEDWVKSFADTAKVILIDSISEAVRLIQERYRDIDITPYYEAVKRSLEPIFKETIEQQWMYLEDGEGSEVTKVTKIKIIEISDDVTPLEISNSQIILSTAASFEVYGIAKVFNEDESGWDAEDKRFMFPTYDDVRFNGSIIDIKCEVKLEIDNENPDKTTINEVSFNWLEDVYITLDADELGYIYHETEGSIASYLNRSREFSCPHCDNDVIIRDLSDYMDCTYSNEREMGIERQYTFEGSYVDKCPSCHADFQVVGDVWEYPEGAINQDNIEITALISEEDAKADMMDALEEHHRHS